MKHYCTQASICPFKDWKGGRSGRLCPFSVACSRAGDRDGITQVQLGVGSRLFASGDPFEGIYILQSGALKTLAELPDHEEQIIDFRFPGDVLGLSSLYASSYGNTASALENSRLCHITIECLEQLLPRHEILEVFSRQLRHVHQSFVMVRKQNAEQRIVHFILDVALSLGFNLNNRIRLRLPMPRKDIANYLGLVVETVSRSLHRLQSEGLIAAHGRNLELLDCQLLLQRLVTRPV